MKHILTVVILPMLFILSGCGGSSNSGGENTTTELEGNWKSLCTPFLGSSFDLTIIFTGNTFSATSSSYNDESCVTLDEATIDTGTFTIGNALTTTSGLSAKEINITTLISDGMTVNSTEYDIFSIMNNNLFLGDSNVLDGSTIAMRPIELDTELSLIKQ